MIYLQNTFLHSKFYYISGKPNQTEIKWKKILSKMTFPKNIYMDGSITYVWTYFLFSPVVTWCVSYVTCELVRNCWPIHPSIYPSHPFIGKRKKKRNERRQRKCTKPINQDHYERLHLKVMNIFNEAENMVSKVHFCSIMRNIFRIRH